MSTPGPSASFIADVNAALGADDYVEALRLLDGLPATGTQTPEVGAKLYFHRESPPTPPVYGIDRIADCPIVPWRPFRC